jgi:hypothetical protein
MNQEYELMKKLPGLVGHPCWEVFELYLRFKLETARESMDGCSADFLKHHQGKVELLKELLTFKENVMRITYETKAQ